MKITNDTNKMLEELLKTPNIEAILAEDISEKVIIMRKYDTFLRYIYPIALKIPNEHKYIKDSFFVTLFENIDLINKALKTDQVSKLYEIDSNISSIRYKIKFLSSDRIRAISPDQQKICSIILCEVGSILNSWISNKQKLKK